jgi:hypothetical protein
MADNKSVFERAMFTALTQADCPNSELRKEKLDTVELSKALKEF